jgi:hypothetical protein
MERDLNPQCAVCGHEITGVEWYRDPFLGWMPEVRCSTRCHTEALRARYEWQLGEVISAWEEDLARRRARRKTPGHQAAAAPGDG